MNESLNRLKRKVILVQNRLAMDTKRRVTIPIEIRKALGKKSERHVILHPGRSGVIILYLPSAFDTFIHSIRRRGGSPKKVDCNRQLLRSVLCSSLRCAPGDRGRIALHPYLWNHSRQPKSVLVRIVGLAPAHDVQVAQCL